MPEASAGAVSRAAQESAALIGSMPFPTGTAMLVAANLLAFRARLSGGEALGRLEPEQQDRWMDRWAAATTPPVRQLAAGVRSISLAAYYSQQAGA